MRSQSYSREGSGEPCHSTNTTLTVSIYLPLIVPLANDVNNPGHLNFTTKLPRGESTATIRSAGSDRLPETPDFVLRYEILFVLKTIEDKLKILELKVEEDVEGIEEMLADDTSSPLAKELRSRGTSMRFASICFAILLFLVPTLISIKLLYLL